MGANHFSVWTIELSSQICGGCELRTWHFYTYCILEHGLPSTLTPVEGFIHQINKGLSHCSVVHSISNLHCYFCVRVNILLSLLRKHSCSQIETRALGPLSLTDSFQLCILHQAACCTQGCIRAFPWLIKEMNTQSSLQTFSIPAPDSVPPSGGCKVFSHLPSRHLLAHTALQRGQYGTACHGWCHRIPFPARVDF